MCGSNPSLIVTCVDPVCNDVNGHAAHFLHRLPHSGERWGKQRRLSDAVEPDYRTLLRNGNSVSAQGTNGAEGGQVVKCHDRSKIAISSKQLFGQADPRIETGERIARLGEIEH